MKALGRCVAVLLIATIATPWAFGFVPSCCKQHAPTPRVAKHRCEHDDAQEPVDSGGSCSTTIHQCGTCTIMIFAWVDRRLPNTNCSQPSVKQVKSLVAISLQFYVPPYSEPPPQDSSTRRATLCSFLI